jgi:hypothetical protein
MHQLVQLFVNRPYSVPLWLKTYRANRYRTSVQSACNP